MDCKPTQAPGPFDIAELREKYRQERDKRVHPEGDSQYLEVSDGFDDFYEVDPAHPIEPRDPVSEEIDVAVLGAGFAGLIASARLKQAGISNIRTIDMAGDFGGTWYWNRYPGLQCDTDACCYMPMLEEVPHVPMDRYAFGEEIHEQCQRIAHHFGLYETALFGTIVRTLKWDEDIRRWRITTNHGDDIRARFIVMGTGPYNRPKLPGIPGIRSFKGHSFHTSRWDYDYTGGDRKGGLTGLADKRVAIIGTGATGIQVIPFLGEYAQHTYVFQRTPSTIDIRGDMSVPIEWTGNQKPGWQAERRRNFYDGTFGVLEPGQKDLICDNWTELNRNIAARLEEMGNPQLSPEEYMALREETDYAVMERLRARIDEVVENPETAEKLKPYYRFLCKRPTFSDDYLPTFNRPNVTLVDVSASRGVDRVTEKGIVANGQEYAVDCIIFASGFEITTSFKRRFGIGAIEGAGGCSLYDHWADGYRTFHGMTSHGFPNMLFMGFTQTGVSVNVSDMYEQQSLHAAYIVREALDRGVSRVEPTAQAEQHWIDHMRETELSNRDFLLECTPGYYNNEGGTDLRSHLGEVYGPGFYAFGELIEEWREAGDMAGLELES